MAFLVKKVRVSNVSAVAHSATAIFNASVFLSGGYQQVLYFTVVSTPSGHWHPPNTDLIQTKVGGVLAGMSDEFATALGAMTPGDSLHFNSNVAVGGNVTVEFLDADDVVLGSQVLGAGALAYAVPLDAPAVPTEFWTDVVGADEVV